MERFRSPLLKSFPHWQDPERLARALRRAQMVSVLGFLILTPTAMVFLDLPPHHGWGFPLYWIHDHIFLPVKGFTFTQYLPYSMAWWILILMLFVFWVWSFVTTGSLLRPAHLASARFCVRNRWLRRRLMRPARFMAARGWPPSLLAEVAAYEQKALVRSFPANHHQGVEVEKVQNLLELTHFQMDLALCPNMSSAAHQRALAGWRAAFLHLQGRTKMSRLATRPIDVLSNYIPKDPIQLRSAISGSTVFSWQHLSFDMLFLSCLEAPELAVKLLGGSLAAQPPVETVRRVCQRLAAATASRREQIDEFRARLENAALRKRNTFTGGFARDPLVGVEETDLPLFGELTMGLALDLARLTGDPGPTLAFMDSLDALRLALSMLNPDQPPLTPTVVKRLELFLGDLPLPRHFQLCAEIASEQLAQRRNQWRESALAREAYLTSDDFGMLQLKISDLNRAGGPNPALGDHP